MKFLKILFAFITAITCNQNTNQQSETTAQQAIKEETQEIVEQIQTNINNAYHYLTYNGTYYVLSKTVESTINDNKYTSLPNLFIAKNVIKIIKDIYGKMSVEEFTEQYEELIKKIDHKIAELLKSLTKNNEQLYQFIMDLINLINL